MQGSFPHGLRTQEATGMAAGDPNSWMWAEALGMLERAERLQRDFFRPGLAGATAAAWEPPVDVLETEDELWIIAALPGVEPGDLQVAIEGDSIRIAGHRRFPPVVRGAAIHRLEVPYGRFERRIRMSGMRLTLARSELANGCLFLGLVKQP
jgi:HSP20 family protein